MAFYTALVYILIPTRIKPLCPRERLFLNLLRLLKLRLNRFLYRIIPPFDYQRFIPLERESLSHC